MNTPARGSSLTERARRYIIDAARAFERAPVEVAVSVLLAIAFSYTLESAAEPWPEWWEFAVIAVLTGGIAFIATLLHALGGISMRTRWMITLAGAVTAALYGLFGLDVTLESHVWRAGALVVALALLVLGAPALAGREGATERYRRVTGRFVIRVLAVLLYATALFVGLALALAAVDSLFELDLDELIYFHVYGWIYIVLVTWAVVGGVDDYVRPAEESGAVGKAVHRLSAFLVTPLVAIYYVILYAYMVRIAVTGELPKNLVSPLVIAAGLLAGIALTLFDRYDDGSRSFRSLRATAPLFVPLGVVGIWAIAMRLDQYGWTEFRAFRVVVLVTLGLLAISATVRVLQRRPLRLHLLPLAFAAVLVLGAIGPWSVMSVSRRSQQARLEVAMGNAGLEWNSTVVQDSIVPDSLYRELDSMTRYLYSHHGKSSLPQLFAQHVVQQRPSDPPQLSFERGTTLVARAGLRSDGRGRLRWRSLSAQLQTGAELATGGAGTLHHVNVQPYSHSGDSTAVTPVALINIGGVTYTANLEANLELIRADSGRILTPGSHRAVLRDESGAERGELLITSISWWDPSLRVTELVGVARLNPN